MTIINTANIQENIVKSTEDVTPANGSLDELVTEHIALLHAAHHLGVDLIIETNEAAGCQVRWTKGD